MPLAQPMGVGLVPSSAANPFRSQNSIRFHKLHNVSWYKHSWVFLRRCVCQALSADLLNVCYHRHASAVGLGRLRSRGRCGATDAKTKHDGERKNDLSKPPDETQRSLAPNPSSMRLRAIGRWPPRPPAQGKRPDAVSDCPQQEKNIRLP